MNKSPTGWRASATEMTYLSEHNLDWARHMVWTLKADGGRDNSAKVNMRRRVSREAHVWLAGLDWDQNNINEKSEQHCR